MSTKSDGQVVIAIVADDKELEKSLRGAQEKSADLGSELQRVNELLQLDPKNVELTKQKQELLTKSVAATKDELEHLKKAQENAQAQFERGEITEAQFRSLTREIASTEQSLDGLNRELKDYEKNGTRANASSEELTNNAAAMSAAFAAAGTALVALGAKAVGVATGYEAAFAKTKTIMDTAVVSAEQMNADVLALSQNTAMGAADVSGAVYEAMSAGIDTANAVGFVNEANMLAVAGFTSLAGATDVLTTTINAYGMSADQVMGISNVLIQTQNLGKITVDELANAMGRAISTGSAYGVDLQNLATMYVQLTSQGIQASEATTYLSGMLNELGNASSEVGVILRTQTGSSFGELMQQGWTLGDVLQILSDSVDGNAEALMNLWGSQEAGKAANAVMTRGVQDFNEVCAQMNAELQGTTGTTERAYATMTSTSEFIDKELNNSLNNLGIAIGEDLNPFLNSLKQGLTGILQGFTEFVSKHPSVSAALAGITVVVAGLGAGLAALTIKAKLTTLGIISLSTAMNMLAAHPVALLITGIASLAVGVAAYAAATEDAATEVESLSAASRAQYYELQELNAEYDRICETQGAASNDAALLKGKIDDLTESYEANKQTQEEFQAELDAVSESYERNRQAIQDNIDAARSESASNLGLIDELFELTSAEEANLATKERILAIVDLLNDRIPELGLSYNSLTGDLNMSQDEILVAARAENAANERKATWEALKTELGEEQTLYDAYQKALDNQQAAQAEYDAALLNLQRWQDAMDAEKPASLAAWTRFENTYGARPDVNGALSALNEAKATTEDAKGKYDQNQTNINTHSSSLAALAEEEAAAIGEVSPLIDEYSAKLSELNETYTEIYNSAYNSITGQFGLWEEAPQVVAMSIDDMLNAVQSQQEYWDKYTSNLDFVGSYTGQIEGLNDVIGMLSDGSEESAAALAAIAKALEDGDITKVEDLVSGLQDVAVSEKKAADAAAANATGYSQKVAALAEQLAKDIEAMNIDATAYTLGNSAIEEFISGAEDQENAVEAAYRLLGETAYHALYESFGAKVLPSSSYNMVSAGAYASGTASAARGVALVGEEGPELVYFRGGERVLTAAETKAALSAVYPTVPDINYTGASAPSVMRQGQVNIHVTVDTPLTVDGREFARGNAEYISEEIMGLM